MPLENIHLKSNGLFEMKESSSKININLFIIISFVILLVSLLNFINLTIAKLIKRSKEIGLNKLVGANNWQLLGQVVIEVLVLCSFSIAISLFSIEWVKPIINNFFEIDFHIYYTDPMVYLSILLVLVICGGLSALFVWFFFMGKSSTIQILQSKNNYSGSFILNSLLVLQIAVVIVLLSNTFLVNKQINYILSKPLGFNKENVVVLNIKDFTKDPKVFANELKKQSYVHSVGFAQQHFGYPTQSLPLESFGIEGSAELVFINNDYLKTMDIKLIQNQIDYDTDTIEGWVFNNHLYKRLLEAHGDREGIESYLASQALESGSTRMRILGVTEDFNYNSAHQEIGDYAFLLGESPQRARFIHVRLNPGDLKTAMNKTQELWNNHYPEQEFNYFFMDDKIAQQYKAEHILVRILSVFSIIGFLISIIGISALSLFISQQHTKEIGIRKVNGAITTEIISLLNKNFIKWVVIAFIIASPVAYMAMNKWLQNFAYKTPISWWIFLLAGCAALGIALLTVSWQSWKAARRNPIEALRYE
jgi:putative ABC transport system permease protein